MILEDVKALRRAIAPLMDDNVWDYTEHNGPDSREVIVITEAAEAVLRRRNPELLGWVTFVVRNGKAVRISAGGSPAPPGTTIKKGE